MSSGEKHRLNYLMLREDITNQTGQDSSIARALATLTAVEGTDLLLKWINLDAPYGKELQDWDHAWSREAWEQIVAVSPFAINDLYVLRPYNKIIVTRASIATGNRQSARTKRLCHRVPWRAKFLGIVAVAAVRERIQRCPGDVAEISSGEDRNTGDRISIMLCSSHERDGYLDSSL